MLYFTLLSVLLFNIKSIIPKRINPIFKVVFFFFLINDNTNIIVVVIIIPNTETLVPKENIIKIINIIRTILNLLLLIFVNKNGYSSVKITDISFAELNHPELPL